jgi:hypothetical protein
VTVPATFGPDTAGLPATGAPQFTAVEAPPSPGNAEPPDEPDELAEASRTALPDDDPDAPDDDADTLPDDDPDAPDDDADTLPDDDPDAPDDDADVLPDDDPDAPDDEADVLPDDEAPEDEDPEAALEEDPDEDAPSEPPDEPPTELPDDVPAPASALPAGIDDDGLPQPCVSAAMHADARRMFPPQTIRFVASLFLSSAVHMVAPIASTADL